MKQKYPLVLFLTEDGIGFELVRGSIKKRSLQRLFSGPILTQYSLNDLREEIIKALNDADEAEKLGI